MKTLSEGKVKKGGVNVATAFPTVRPKPPKAIRRKPRFVSVNGLNIRTNNRIIREGSDEPLKPVIRVQEGLSGKALYGDEFEFFDAEGNVVGRIRYETDRVLRCGAKCVIEFDYDIKKVR